MRCQITQSSKRIFNCWCPDSNEYLQATAPARILKQGHPVPGDWVQVEDGEILELEKRSGVISRRIPREQKTRVVAANVHSMAIVASTTLPAYKEGLLDRYLIRATQWELPAAIIFNKMDQFQNEFDLAKAITRFEQIGVKCFEVCSLPSTDHEPSFGGKGLVELKAALRNNLTIMLGQSGVGKSKLITKLTGQEVHLESGELGKIGKGKHTTTRSEVIRYDDFALVDSPGIRSLSLDDIGPEELAQLFPDLSSYFQQCKFTNCTHESNAKGCAFNELDHETHWIELSRLKSYLRFKEEIQKLY